LGAEFTYDNEGRYDHDINNGGDRDDEIGEREHDDRYFDPQPLHNGDVYDQTGPSCAAAIRYVVRNEARVTKRQISIALVTTEQRSREEIMGKASRTDAAQHQIVSKQLSKVVPHSSFGDPVTAPGMNGSILRTSDARRQSVADSLVYAPGKQGALLCTLRAVRGEPADNADSVASRGSAQLVQYVGNSPLPHSNTEYFDIYDGDSESIESALPAQDASRNGEHPNPRQQTVNDTTEQTPREKCWYWNTY
jgi:hypothetical protein